MNSSNTCAEILVHIAAKTNGADILYGLRVQFLKLVSNHFFGFRVTHKMMGRSVASLNHWLVRKKIPDLELLSLIKCPWYVVDIKMYSIIGYNVM